MSRGPELIITEKDNAARRIADILSGETASAERMNGVNVYKWGGKRCIGLSGHVVGVDFPPEYNDWRDVEPVELIGAPSRNTPRRRTSSPRCRNWHARPTRPPLRPTTTARGNSSARRPTSSSARKPTRPSTACASPRSPSERSATRSKPRRPRLRPRGRGRGPTDYRPRLGGGAHALPLAFGPPARQRLHLGRPRAGADAETHRRPRARNRRVRP